MGLLLRHCLVVLAAAALTFGIASAQSPTPVVVSAVRVVPGTYGSGGLSAVTTIRVSTMTAAANNSLFYDRAITFSKANLSGAARSRLAAGVASAAALSGVIIAAGWAIDYLTGQVTNTASSTPSLCHIISRRGGTGLTSGSGPVNVLVCGPTPEAFASLLRDTWQDNSYAYGDPFTISGNSLTASVYHYSNWSAVHHTTTWNLAPPASVPAPGTYTAASQAASAISDTALADRVATSPAAITEAITLTNGQPNAAIVPIPATLAEVQAAHRAATANPLTVGQTEPVAATAANSAAAPSTWPDFCVFAPTFCAWFGDEGSDDVDLPEKEIAVTASGWTSGLGSGTCPAPSTLTLSAWTGSVTYQPYCDLAALIRPLVLLSAALYAAFIIAGLRNA